MTTATFQTVLVATGGNNVGIEVPEDVLLGFAHGKRVPVVVTVDGGYTYSTTTGVMGGRYLVSASGGQVSLCGFSAPYSEQLAAVFAEAFPT